MPPSLHLPGYPLCPGPQCHPDPTAPSSSAGFSSSSLLLPILSPSSSNTDNLEVETRSHHCPSLNASIAFRSQDEARLHTVAREARPILAVPPAPLAPGSCHSSLSLLSAPVCRRPCTARGLLHSRQYFTVDDDRARKHLIL